MAREYSDSIPTPMSNYPALIVDSGSPIVSVALDQGDAPPVVRSLRQRRSSGSLLLEVREVLNETGQTPRDLRSLVGLRGPGSFTGLRVGLSMLLGLREALGIRATGLSTLETLAAWSAPLISGEGIVVAAVDAMREEWFLQPFSVGPERAPRPIEPPRCLGPADLSELVAEGAPRALVGYGATALATRAGLAGDWLVGEPESLAGAACDLLRMGDIAWDADLLCDPLYLRPPAVRTAG